MGKLIGIARTAEKLGPMEEIGRVGYAAPAHVTWTSSEDGVTLAAPRAGDGSQTAGEDAALLREPIIVQRRSNGDGSDNAVTLPIVLRDQLFGALRFHVPADTWNSNLEAILIGIAGHVAQAIENARLIEQTRRAAQREKDIAAAADKIHRPSEIDAIMRTAIEELSRITGTPDVSIRLGVGDSSNGDGRGE